MKRPNISHTSQNIVCFGDSLTEVNSEAEIDRWPTRLQMAMEQWKPGAFKVFNRGASGNTTAQALEGINMDVEPHLPGWVLVAFGANDANVRQHRRTPRVSTQEFEKNLREINRHVRLHQGKCIFVAMHFPHRDPRIRTGNGKTSMENYRGHYQAILRTAKALRIPAIDMPRLLKRKNLSSQSIVCADGIHLSTCGNHVCATIIFEELKAILDKKPNNG